MDFILESPQAMLRSIAVAVPTSEVNQAFDHVVKEYGQESLLLGVCEKNAPLLSLEKRFVKEIQAKVQAALADLAIEQATAVYQLQPVNRILFEGDTPLRDKDFSFYLHCEVLPEIPLPEKLESLSVSVQEPSFETKEYHCFLQRLRRTKAQFQDLSTKRLPQDGDVVFLKIQGSYQGAPVLGMEHASIVIPLEAHYQESPELASVARTLHVGEQATTTMQLPKGYPDANLCGQTIDIELALSDIKIENLPEVNEDFAISLGFKNMQDVQKFICHEILNKNITLFQKKAEELLLRELIDVLDFPLPASLLALHKNEYLAQACNYYKQCGLNNEALQKKMQDCQTESEQVAMQKTKRQAFLMALGYREKVQISNVDIDQAIEVLAKQNGHEYETLHASISTSGAVYELQDRLLADKAMRVLYTQAKKCVVDAHGKPVQKMDMPVSL